ncbi:hypothetical protein WKI68_05585 [Streptomyces sp. MS1.HAVA.3]|uniref:Uncharacterized protein n=1 Tax=Streptomyces caledonius TaxID=3134107 RepID=A0ABU8TZN6_9ACTN
MDGFSCLVRGKADAQAICVEPALEHENVHMVTGANGATSTWRWTRRTTSKG